MGQIEKRNDGGACLRCGRRSIACICAEVFEDTGNKSGKPAKPVAVHVALESKGRGGKQVTVVSGLPLADAELQKLGSELRQACGSGGTTKDGRIEIQGDRRQQIIAALQGKGYKVK